jgi:hypothetical protein
MYTRLLFVSGLALVTGSGCSTKLLGEPDPSPGGFLPGSVGGSGGPVTPVSVGPTFSMPVTAADPPPPISGGTLLMLRGAGTVVAADPDRDTISIVDVGLTLSLRATITLESHDEPGRLVEDGAGRVHVVLRRGGALVTIDVAAAKILARRDVCVAPRGVAYEASRDLVHVACRGGELVSLPAAGGEAVRTVRLSRDLRDVVVDGDRLLVSRFRAADVLIVDSAGTQRGTLAPAAYSSPEVRGGARFSPALAWNMKADPAGGALLLHQRGESGPGVSAQYYGEPMDMCAAAVHPALARVGVGQPPAASPPLAGLVLAVDFALSPDGGKLAVVAAGNAYNAAHTTLFVSSLSAVTDGTVVGCRRDGSHAPQPPGSVVPTQPAGEVVAVAFDSRGRVVAQTREPPAIHVEGAKGAPAFVSTPLSNVSRADVGHAVFHADAGAGVACASCHAEGEDDGRVWRLGGIARRTMNLAGGIGGRAPYHWDGGLTNFLDLIAQTYVARMRGPELRAELVNATFHWVNAIPALPSVGGDPTAIARGHTLFEDSARTGCATCHTGFGLGSGPVMDVGTGGRFKVPSLAGLAWRAPYLHDGCAKTLEERFGTCGSSAHGVTSSLSAAEMADLITYLESL